METGRTTYEGLERIAGEVPSFKFIATISRPWEDAAWKGETGRVDDLVRKQINRVCVRRQRPHICAGIQPCAKTDKVSFSALAGRRAPFLKTVFHPRERSNTRVDLFDTETMCSSADS